MSIRLVHVGLGGWGRDWAANALPPVRDEVECVALVDADATTLASVRDRLGFDERRSFRQLGAALQAVDADAVLVTASVQAHVPLAVEALHAGKHVLVEKPFATTVADARRLVELADSLDLTLMVSQNYRFYPAARKAAQLVAEEAVGPLGAVRVDFRKWANGARPGKAHRHYHLRHPLLYDMAIHHFDLMRMVLGQEPVRVFTQVTDPNWSNFDDVASAAVTITFDGGTVVSYRGSWVSTGAPTTWAGDWHLECRDGEIFWTGREGASGMSTGDVVRVRRLETGGRSSYAAKLVDVPELSELPETPLIGRSAALSEFARAITAGDEPESSGRRNLQSLALSVTAARSAATGQVEEIAAAD